MLCANIKWSDDIFILSYSTVLYKGSDLDQDLIVPGAVQIDRQPSTEKFSG